MNDQKLTMMSVDELWTLHEKSGRYSQQNWTLKNMNWSVASPGSMDTMTDTEAGPSSGGHTPRCFQNIRIRSGPSRPGPAAADNRIG